MLSEAIEQYKLAYKAGQKNYKDCVIHRRYPYPQVLDEILANTTSAGQVSLGIVEVPTEMIIGTKTPGRKTAFSSNFMPLLEQGTEFAQKWINLCSDHFDEGIREPVKCYEYFGQFYVQEGNKRVSVLKSLGAASVTCDVIRVIPSYSNEPEVRAYYEFMQFFQYSQIYQIQFDRVGAYSKLQALLGFEPEHVWTHEERKSILSRFTRFEQALKKVSGICSTIESSKGFLVWLQLYSLEDANQMTEAELETTIKKILDDIRVQSAEDPIRVKTAPPDENEKSLLNRLFGIGKISRLNVAFIYDRSPEDSPWTAAHDLGRQHLESCFAGKVSVRVYNMLSPNDDAETLMEQAVSDGAKVIFATTPPLISACRKIAVKYPDLYILNCSVSMPYSGVRTYYSRIYEGKFITGAIAGAMSEGDAIGYVASYPILGVPASINAFALGAQMTNPNATIQLHWSCTPGNYQDIFTRKGIQIISNRDVPSATHPYVDWGTYIFQKDGSLRSLASPYWNWGQFYEKIISQILEGLWDTVTEFGGKKPVSYWWGMESNVIDIRLNDSLPEGIKQLALILREGIKNGSIDIFRRKIISQDGTVRNDGTQWFSPERILNMDWLCSNVEGSIPSYDHVLPMSQPMVRLLGIYRDQIPPEKGAAIL